MEWWLIVMGVGLFGLAIGLTIGMILPRNSLTDIYSNFFWLIIIFILFVSGLFAVAYGLKK